ncbi:hypothetical protein Barb4_04062 [Bacteroidales bacterium Barb4]|nr:hypothetical protein Barb4_04062 [Bacteroidales bacterium Barb4]
MDTACFNAAKNLISLPAHTIACGNYRKTASAFSILFRTPPLFRSTPLCGSAFRFTEEAYFLREVDEKI